ncbi:hypothetical protein [Neobacillus drentensis]
MDTAFTIERNDYCKSSAALCREPDIASKHYVHYVSRAIAG